MKCPKCGNTIDEKSNICPYCGVEIKKFRYKKIISISIIFFTILTFLIFLVFYFSNKNKKTTWEKILKDTRNAFVSSVVQTKDGGYILTGKIEFKEKNDFNIFVFKLNKNGDKEWEKNFGGIDNDEANYILNLSDGNYIILGVTKSFNKGSSDIYVLKIDKNGNKIWEKNFGSEKEEGGLVIYETEDKGFIIGGYIYSDEKRGNDFYILKLNKDGEKEWEKIFGGMDNDYVTYIQQTKEGGYIFIGNSKINELKNSDIYFNIFKLDKTGEKEWEKNYYGKGKDDMIFIKQIVNVGYIAIGNTTSYSGGDYDFYIIKLDNEGEKKLEKIYGGISDDIVKSVEQTKDGGFILAGYTRSFEEGGANFYIVKLDKNLEKEWEKTFGNKGDDYIAYSIKQIDTGGYVVCGNIESKDGNSNIYIIKLDKNGNK